MAKQIVTGDKYRDLDGKMLEIKRQLNQKNGYPFSARYLEIALQNIVEGKFFESAFPGLEVWRTINFGEYKSETIINRMVEDRGSLICEDARRIIASPLFYTSGRRAAAAPEPKLDLVKVTPRDLGLKQGCMRKDFYARAFELRLKLCPPDLGLELREQPMEPGENMVIGMEPIVCPITGQQKLFCLENLNHNNPGYLDAPDEEAWILRTIETSPHTSIFIDSEYIFVK